MDVAGLPAGFTVDLSDDPGQLTATSGSTAAGRWAFFFLSTDGGILGTLPFPGDWTITVAPQFLFGIGSWNWVQADTSRAALTLGETVTIEALSTSSACRTDCTIPRCGDGILDGGEVCDDGGAGGCAPDCKSFR
jgi:hypothetical protein